MLDSGGAYGRSWQANQGRAFEAEPAATLTIEEGYIDIKRSTFHFLNECLEFDEAMNKRFREFCRAEDPENVVYQMLLMEEFVESIEATGIYGEGDPITVNTYNHDSLLDQVLQYVYFEIEKQGYVLLQVHRGCDVRGGYTAPKAFRCNIEDSPSIFDDGDAVVGHGDGEHRWYVEEGHWDTDHWKDPDERGLNKFPIIADEAEYHKVREKGEIAEGAAFGVIWQDAQGVHCPLCGEILEVW